jgi:hypothetical protein
MYFVAAKRGARYLTGENLKVARAEFSILSYAKLVDTERRVYTQHIAPSRVENSVQVSSGYLKFVHGMKRKKSNDIVTCVRIHNTSLSS